jgi:hypothetical protein
MPVSRIFFYVIFRVPSKETSSPSFPHKAPTKRDASFPEPSFINLAKFLVNEPLSRFPSTAPMERDARLLNFFLHNLQGPQ